MKIKIISIILLLTLILNGCGLSKEDESEKKFFLEFTKSYSQIQHGFPILAGYLKDKNEPQYLFSASVLKTALTNLKEISVPVKFKPISNKLNDAVIQIEGFTDLSIKDFSSPKKLQELDQKVSGINKLLLDVGNNTYKDIDEFEKRTNSQIAYFGTSN